MDSMSHAPAGAPSEVIAATRSAYLAALRQRVIEVSYLAKSAHLGSSLSCIEILDCIIRASGLTPENMTAPHRPRLVMSKGHAAMAFYAALEAWGLIPKTHLDRYLQDGTALWGHVTRSSAVPAIDVSTGSLGHGLGLAAGYALGYRLRGWTARSFCVLSDGECDEGSTWEAILFAGHHRLSNMVAIVDYNKIQSIDRVSNVLELEPFADKWQSFNWTVREVDGHDPWAMDAVLGPPATERPLVVIAHTVKGKGVPRVENTVASHYHPARESDRTGHANA
jgi:transketolase